MARGTGQIAGQDYMNSYSRILDALKIGTGASAAAGASGQQFSNQIGAAGTNQANITLDQGQSDANLWRGLSQVPGQAVTAYQNAQAPPAPLTTFDTSTNMNAPGAGPQQPNFF
jgi:hypothetical protein